MCLRRNKNNQSNAFNTSETRSSLVCVHGSHHEKTRNRPCSHFAWSEPSSVGYSKRSAFVPTLQMILRSRFEDRSQKKIDVRLAFPRVILLCLFLSSDEYNCDFNALAFQ